MGGLEQKMLAEQGGGEDENTSRPYGFHATVITKNLGETCSEHRVSPRKCDLRKTRTDFHTQNHQSSSCLWAGLKKGGLWWEVDL